MKILKKLNEELVPIDKIITDLSLDVRWCAEQKRIILNYHQLATPRGNPVGRECRGLTLYKENGQYKVAARAFDRFFNLFESRADDNKFNWGNFECYEKVDGSLMLLYKWEGNWRVNTRGSFANASPSDLTTKTWEQLFHETGIRSNEFDNLDGRFTYVFEFCSPFTQVIKYYGEPTLYLLAVVDNETGLELSKEYVDELAFSLGVRRPQIYKMSSAEECLSFLANTKEIPNDYEGFVVKDSNANRLKIKNKRWLYLMHKKGNNAEYINSRKNLLEVVLTGEFHELAAYLPFIRERGELMERRINEEVIAADTIWCYAKSIVSQKEFALYVQKHSNLSGLLFECRKHNCKPSDFRGTETFYKAALGLVKNI